MPETEYLEQNNSKEIWAAANRVAALFYTIGSCVAIITETLYSMNGGNESYER